MAPKEIQDQTVLIVKCLFEDFDDVHERGQIESDGAEEDSFDPAIIADKLRELGDHYDEAVIQPLIEKLKKAPSDKVGGVFDKCVEQLSKTWSHGELGAEICLLKATVVLGLGVKNKMPHMAAAVQEVMAAFLNRHLVPWVQQRGGWDEVASS